MSTPLRVLIVEDSDDDCQLLLRELRRGGYAPEYGRVETEQAMKAALVATKWDAVISDYVMPKFGGLGALRVHRASGLDLPFIVVSGKMGEDTAVEAMKAGAHDYLLKSNLVRLNSVIKREMEEARIRAERRAAEERVQAQQEELQQQNEELRTAYEEIKRNEEALRESEEHFRSLFKNMINGFVLYDVIKDDQGNAIDVRYVDINPAFERIMGLKRVDVVGRTLLEVFPEVDRERIRKYGEVAAGGKPITVERDRYDTGQFFETFIYSPQPDHVAVIFQDITERKRGEVRQKARLDLLNGLHKAESIEKCLPLVCNAAINAQLFKRVIFILYGPEGHIANFCFCGFDKSLEKRLKGGRVPDPKSLKSVLSPKFQVGDASLVPAEKAAVMARLFQIIPGSLDPQASGERWDNGDVLLVPIKIAKGEIEGWFWLDSPYDSRNPIQDKITYIEEISNTVAFKIYQIRLNQELAAEQKALEEKNIALREILASIEVEKRDIRRQVAEVVDEVLLPAATRMVRKNNTLNLTYYNLLINNLKELAAASGSVLYSYSKLSPREQEISSLIKNGATSKEIAEALGIAPVTVFKHREIIRKKLGLTNKSVNLVTHLRNLQKED